MPLEIRGAHFLIRSAQCAGNTLRIGPACKRRNVFEFAQPGFQFAHSGFNKMGGQRPSYD